MQRILISKEDFRRSIVTTLQNKWKIWIYEKLPMKDKTSTSLGVSSTSNLNVGVNSSIFHACGSKVNNFDFCWLNAVAFKGVYSMLTWKKSITYIVQIISLRKKTHLVHKRMFSGFRSQWIIPASFNRASPCRIYFKPSINKKKQKKG